MATTAAQIVDLILYRYGKPSNTVDARAEALRYANMAQGLLWTADDWPFKREELALTLTDGANKYSLSNDTAQVFWVKNAAGKALKYIPARTFRTVYLPDITTGAPLVYTVDGRVISTSEQKLILWVWPNPTTLLGAGTATLGYEISLPKMTDASNVYSRIPERHRDVLIAWALEFMVSQQNNPALWQAYQAERQEGLSLMRREYGLQERDKK